MNDPRRKRLLILTPRFPYPVIGGDRLRIHYLCRELARHYSLTLLSLCDSEQELRMPVPNDGIFERVERVYLSKYRSYFNTLLAVPTRTPLQVAYYRSRAFAEAARRLLPEHDGVLVHLIRCAEYVRYTDGPKVLEMTDAISLNYGRIKQLGLRRGLKARVFSLEAKRLQAYEQRVAQDFDLSILVSQTDKDFLFQGEAGKHVMVCSNGVSLTHMPFQAPRLDSRIVIFIGDMRTVQNQDMCHYFATQMLPILRARADYRFRIVGAVDEQVKQQFAAYEGVEVSGRVASIREAVRDGAVGVCPMRIGAGVQNKVLEYMALGLPVVTTSLGLEGFGARDKESLLVADSPEQFAESIDWLVRHPEQALRLAESAREYVQREHDWTGVTAPLMDRLAAVLNERQNRAL